MPVGAAATELQRDWQQGSEAWLLLLLMELEGVHLVPGCCELVRVLLDCSLEGSLLAPQLQLACRAWVTLPAWIAAEWLLAELGLQDMTESEHKLDPQGCVDSLVHQAWQG